VETTDRDATDPRLRALNDAEPGAEVEARILRGAMARLQDAPRRRRAARWLVPAAAVGAAAAAAWLVGPLSESRPEPGTYVAESAPRTLRLGPHRVELAAGTTAELVRSTPEAVALTLDRGRLACAVDALGAGERFEVETAQVRVTVVGTRFRVATDADCTQVEVDEGRVRVEDGHGEAASLTAGDARSFCAPEPAHGPERGPEPPSEADSMRAALDRIADGDVEAAIDRLKAYRTRHPEGTFIEDALFHQAVLEIRRGRIDVARSLVNRFAARFPDSSRRKTLEDMLRK